MNLVEAIEAEKYTDRLNGELEELRKLLAHDKNKDLEMFKDEISELLREEIVSRYYYQTGRAQSSLIGDPVVDKAVEILNDEEQYASILKVQ